MSINKSLMASVVVFLVLAVGVFAWAGSEPLALMADKSHEGAGGTAIISDNSLKIEANGLKPNGVYTAWFVNMKPKKEQAGAGAMPYMFKTDAAGNGQYESALSESAFGKWSMIMIVLHPTGDPTDMKNMAPALSAMIPNNK